VVGYSGYRIPASCFSYKKIITVCYLILGLGESMADHATPTLDAGMQMLQSLEASGDLDTPLSAESEVTY
jgi:hypothetical protein